VGHGVERELPDRDRETDASHRSYQDNFSGDGIDGISDKDWVQARNGFVVEMGDKAEYGSFANFQDKILASKVAKDSSSGFQRQIAYEREGRKLEMDWNCYSEAFSKRLVDGKDDPWPDLLASPDFAVGTGATKTADASISTLTGKSVWLLSAAPVKTWVGYQPNAEETLPLVLKTPVAELKADAFPFGKLIVRQTDDGKLSCEIDASYRPFFHHPERAAIYQARGTLPSVIRISTGAPEVSATLNGRPCPVTKENGGFVINPYHDPKPIREDAGF
ncbi:MAG TPA: hypothetical protein VM511_03860, partial [Luteolibacter sp.]|nr:hypothetical protein [Luteolibacter sp.]